MPTNLYGPNDNYHAENSHVPAALIRRFHEAKLANAPTVVVWGSGKPRREFLYADDAADACIFIMKHYSDAGFLNIGTGADVAISEFAQMVAETVRLKRRNHLRHLATRRNAAKASRRFEAAKTRLDRTNIPARQVSSRVC
jgi:GDP-L-fucose synthase